MPLSGQPPDYGCTYEGATPEGVGIRCDYWQEYIAGLRIGHQGLEIDTDEELEENRQCVGGRAGGYHAGLMAEAGGGVN